ncbi:Helix-turn-helix [Paenibacillus sp. UNC496MF]|uniref:helix-turn-helix domain-containing protein n=1 Tax=Paenibacillus sp. UNC496MF TaxID=1502753 RepID=UPI0008ED6195|nr:Helix-turn-helix [Paenibacillus sp. UNC496MF]
MTFGERLADLRKKNKLTQEQLAQRIGVSQSTLAMYETSKREPSFDTLLLISEIFDVSTDFLLGKQ